MQNQSFAPMGSLLRSLLSLQQKFLSIKTSSVIHSFYL